MIAHRVEFTKSAKKEFDNLSKRMQDRVVEALSFLSRNPFSELLRIKKIKGAESLYRVRLSDYRLVYEVLRHNRRVIVIKIGHRSEVYRRF